MKLEEVARIWALDPSRENAARLYSEVKWKAKHMRWVASLADSCLHDRETMAWDDLERQMRDYVSD